MDLLIVLAGIFVVSVPFALAFDEFFKFMEGMNHE